MNRSNTVVGIDVGGTFTDVAVLSDGQLSVHKLPSTPDDPSRGVQQGIADVGVLALEDAETGTMTLVDTSNEAWREYFAGQVGRHEASKDQIFATLGVDSIKIETGTDYVAKLTRFFRLRARRLGR